ncbi:MAG: hypothetical protein OEQ12_06220 [Nitrosopumilus sp.]|nr:hypothetical protein [Nitrosopumilus sp.]
MKTDSCRKCGTKLEVNKTCQICKEANQFFCHSCGNTTEEQIHFQCMMISLDYALLEIQSEKR